MWNLARSVMRRLRAIACGPGRRSSSVMLGHACETLAAMYFQRGPPIAKNKTPAHRTHRTHSPGLFPCHYCFESFLPACSFSCRQEPRYVCMYVCMHVCMYIYIYACVYVCMYVSLSELCNTAQQQVHNRSTQTSIIRVVPGITPDYLPNRAPESHPDLHYPGCSWYHAGLPPEPGSRVSSGLALSGLFVVSHRESAPSP